MYQSPKVVLIRKHNQSILLADEDQPASSGFLVALCFGGPTSNLCAKPSEFLSCMRKMRHARRHLYLLHVRSDKQNLCTP